MSIENYLEYSTKKMNSNITYFYEFERYNLSYTFNIYGTESKYFYHNKFLPFFFENCLINYFKKKNELIKLKKKDLALIEPNVSLYHMKVNNVLKQTLINNILLDRKTYIHDTHEETIRYFISQELNRIIVKYQEIRTNYFIIMSNNIKQIKKEINLEIQKRKDRKFEVYSLCNNRLNLDVFSIINEYL